MNRRLAVGLFLGVCVALSALLLTHVIRPVQSSAVFAVALAGFGLLSRGFTKSV